MDAISLWNLRVFRKDFAHFLQGSFDPTQQDSPLHDSFDVFSINFFALFGRKKLDVGINIHETCFYLAWWFF